MEWLWIVGAFAWHNIILAKRGREEWLEDVKYGFRIRLLNADDLSEQWERVREDDRDYIGSVQTVNSIAVHSIWPNIRRLTHQMFIEVMFIEVCLQKMDYRTYIEHFVTLFRCR